MADDLDRTVQAQPSKEFFIDMLTRDISLQECILDLLDNSVHSLIRAKNLDVMESMLKGQLPKKTVSASVDIDFSPARFTIKDTCGGITITEAKEQVFLFGKPQPDPKHSGLGVYGIGMKRAVFKIGNLVSVESQTTGEIFKVEIDVDKWKKKPTDWTLEFTYAKKAKNKTSGTNIEVKALHETAKKYFGMSSFENMLRERIATTYALFLCAGLSVRVNGKAVKQDIPTIAESESLKPTRQTTKKNGVDILIVAGLSPKTDRRGHGWYIFCNGRLVLAREQTERTGWGQNNVPNFHPKYNHFLGFVYFQSKDVRKLPWTTTKEGVERESIVYQYALQHMRTIGRPILDFLNDMYGDVEVRGVEQRELLDKAAAVNLEKVAGRSNTAFKADVKRIRDDDLVAIQYKKKRKDVEKVKKAIGSSGMSLSAVGEYTFDWYLRRNT